jgi:hypothetical protein
VHLSFRFPGHGGLTARIEGHEVEAVMVERDVPSGPVMVEHELTKGPNLDEVLAVVAE